MQLKIYKPLWGHVGTLDEAIDQAVDAGFDGIEGQVPESRDQQQHLQDRLEAANLEMIAEIYTGGNYVPNPQLTPDCHLEDLRRGLDRSLSINPRFINTQTGLDAWPLGLANPYFEGLLDLEREFDITISVETHRSRSTYSPWATRDLIRSLPDLKLTVDFSHWCCVAERLVMNDDPSLLEEFAHNTNHIHARIGYDQGPQVPDPRAPEYEEDNLAHLKWWRKLWDVQASLGFDEITMTPEFGTDGYLHLEPYTKKPVADLWEINQWMANRLREEFRLFKPHRNRGLSF